MHKFHSGEIRWNLCPLPPTTKAAAAWWCSSQQCSKEFFSSCVSAAPFQAATSWTTPIPSSSWTSSFTPTSTAHGLERSKTPVDKTCLFAEHSIFIEYWFTVKDIRICCWSAKKRRKEKKVKLANVNFNVWIFIPHVLSKRSVDRFRAMGCRNKPKWSSRYSGKFCLYTFEDVFTYDICLTWYVRSFINNFSRYMGISCFDSCHLQAG